MRPALPLLALLAACTREGTPDTTSAPAAPRAVSADVPDAGCTVEIASDIYPDGITDMLSTLVYDAEGRLLLSTTDGAIGGRPDGIAEYAYEYTYDARGNMVTYTSRSVSGADTQVSHHTYTYDADDQLVRSEFDAYGDGTVDTVIVREWDADGNLLRVEADYGADGVPEYIDVYTYDDRGNALLWTTDQDGDEVADASIAYVYDAEDRPVLESWDLFADGTIDQTTERTYDAEGNEARVEESVVHDPDASNVIVRTFDAEGNVLTDTTTYGSGWLTVVTHTWSDSDLPLSSRIDHHGDGDDDAAYMWSYDERDRESEYLQDNDGDGAIDAISTWSWGC